MSQETKERAKKASANADESAAEKGTNGVMLAMIMATILAVGSALSVPNPNRQVETFASEATEQSLQQAQPSPLPAQSNDRVQPIAQQPVQQQSVQQPIQPSILPSEPIQQNQIQSGTLPAQP
ncbi:hypothetical protein H6F67_22575 [Microcoleus sp. FACHB-1515]|uniref:hypothetical protein n=1 Tax=Cyanophyceae TaxID=3028117 RepID=UPI0016833F14|nr:hypothetical protein [Microcoleus sp. FACHB-1515]MBD2092639.1 hypothetical protein [Microcoleus sp. FACHB-1515]